MYEHFLISKKKAFNNLKSVKKNVQNLALKVFNIILFKFVHKIFAQKESILYKHPAPHSRIFITYLKL